MGKVTYTKNPKKEKGIIPLANGWGIVAPLGVGDASDIMVAIGALTVLYAEAFKQNKESKEKLKAMMNEYIDSIYDGKLPEGVFAKKSKNGKIN